MGMQNKMSVKNANVPLTLFQCTFLCTSLQWQSVNIHTPLYTIIIRKCLFLKVFLLLGERL